MEFDVNSTAFKNAVLDVTRLISAKAAQPILTSMKISATTEGITIVGGNTIMTMKSYLPYVENSESDFNIIETGSILIPPTYFVEVLKKLPMKIHIKVDANFQLTIKSEGIKTTLSGMDPTQYPNLPSLERGKQIRIDVGTLIQMIDSTLFAVSHNDANPALTGVNWFFDEQNWYSIATNSQRLVLAKRTSIDINGSYVIPGKTLAECIHIFKNYDKEITITFSDRFILFQVENVEFYSNLISSSFPQFKKLVPTETKTEVILETTKFLKGIERTSLLSNTKKNHNVTLAIGENNTITLDSDAGEIGGITEKQLVIQVAGDINLHIIFDGKYMKESLGAIEDETIKLSFAGPFRPIRIEPVEGDAYLHLISPLRG